MSNMFDFIRVEGGVKFMKGVKRGANYKNFGTSGRDDEDSSLQHRTQTACEEADSYPTGIGHKMAKVVLKSKMRGH
jgi:hypothetical protein